MAIASLEEPCTGFREIPSRPLLPAPVPDEHGSLAFTPKIHDVPVVALHVCSRPERVFVILEFGALG